MRIFGSTTKPNAGTSSACVLGAILAAGPVLLGTPQTQPDPAALLQQLGRTYRGAMSGRFEGYTTRTPEGSAPSSAARRPFGFAFETPDRLRQEAVGPLVAPLMITDGETTWIYRRDYRQYRQFAGRAFDLPPLERIRQSDQRLKSARLLGAETVTIDGIARDCWIVEADYEEQPDTFGLRPSVRFWIDKTQPIVRQEWSALGASEVAPRRGPRLVEATVYAKAELNIDLPDDLFTFLPPLGAMQVDRFQDPSTFDLTGRRAPQVTLRGLDGVAFDLESQRGKVVLLDFWAAWCLPCRAEMPVLQKLHEEFRSRGLVVVGITRGEAREIHAFLSAHGITFPALNDPTNGAAKAYLVTGIPIGVVIDRQGNVSSYFPGLRSEQEWRDALVKAGLGKNLANW